MFWIVYPALVGTSDVRQGVSETSRESSGAPERVIEECS